MKAYRPADSKDVARALVQKLGRPEQGCAALDPFILIIASFSWFVLLAVGYGILYAVRFGQ